MFQVLYVICGIVGLICSRFFCQEQEINDELEFLIIASDGLWDVVPNEVSLWYTSLTYLEVWISLLLRFLHEHLCSGVIQTFVGPLELRWMA